MMNLLDAAYHVVHDYPGGAASLAPRMGKGVSSLSHEVTATGTAKMGLIDAEKITQLTGDLRILLAWAGNAGMMLVPLPAEAGAPSKDAMLRLSTVAIEFAEMCAEVASSVGDNHVTDNELSRIDRECGELIAGVHAMRTTIASIHRGSGAAAAR